VFVLARPLLHSSSLATLAALMFVLAPKASSTVVFWISAGGYQLARSLGEARAARFSRALAGAFRADRALGAYGGAIVLTAADEQTERLLRNGVGGYTSLVVTRAIRPDASAWPPPAVDPRDALIVRCLARDGTVTLTIER
jgi:hypothetical protein